MNRLNASSVFRGRIAGSEVDFESNDIGIVHFGPGAFHRAHQAVYTHDVLAEHGRNWCILGVSLQSTNTADQLNAQDSLYTLVERGEGEPHYRLIKSISKVVAAVRDKGLVIEALSAETTRIVSMTVTEKAYGVLSETGEVDPAHPAIAHDLENPADPVGIIGFITKGLKDRKARGIPPYTVLCCDNLSHNGDLVRNGVLDFARRIGEQALAGWIEEEGAFPNSMVDRITPAVPPELIGEVSDYLGCQDLMPVETEPFSQWVIEDRFVSGRPQWEDAGVLFVDDVRPYEEMKLRMLNGAHSLIAYMGFLSGKKHVRDVMADPAMACLVDRHIKAASETLEPLKEIDFNRYREQLIQRFQNPNIAHETYQIAMDGSQKMPQRIFGPALDALTLNQSVEPFSFATASWMFYCSGVNDGSSYSLRDPRECELKQAFGEAGNSSEDICQNFARMENLIPAALAENARWKHAVAGHLAFMIKDGMEAAIVKMNEPMS